MLVYVPYMPVPGGGVAEGVAPGVFFLYTCGNTYTHFLLRGCYFTIFTYYILLFSFL